MKICVKDERCIGCGSCVSVTDEVIFDFNDEGKAYAKVEEIEKEEDIEMVKTAMEYCPTDAIVEVKDNENTSINENAVEIVNKENTSLEEANN